MKLSLTTMALFAGSCSFLPARAATLDGTWRLVGAIQDHPISTVCVIVEKEGKLSGTCVGGDGKTVPITGTVKETEIKWQYDSAYEGTGITMFYTGKLDKADHLTGGIYVEPFAVDGNFTATRDKSAYTSAPTS